MIDFDRFNKLTIRLRASGIKWASLLENCDQIVLFGSWAATVERDNSDVDLLCIGEGKRTKHQDIDLVWLSSPMELDADWLGSELSNHIAKYGIWLHGEDNWSKHVFLSSSAINFKRKLIQSRAYALKRLWNNLSFGYRRKHALKIRRDIQRLSLMKNGCPVPPSAFLDQEWSLSTKNLTALISILQEIDELDLLDSSELYLVRSWLAESIFDIKDY